jgi:hypothetical protein
MPIAVPCATVGGKAARTVATRYASTVTNPPTARELWPLIQRLPREERLRLAKLALRSAAEEGSAEAAYAEAPVGTDEFSSDEESLAWDADGWEEFSAAR